MGGCGSRSGGALGQYERGAVFYLQHETQPDKSVRKKVVGVLMFDRGRKGGHSAARDTGLSAAGASATLLGDEQQALDTARQIPQGGLQEIP